MKYTKVLIAVALLIATTGAGCTWFGNEEPKAKTYEEMEEEKFLSYGTYFMIDPQLEGQTVKIREVKFATPGFAVVREVKADGSIGGILGFSDSVPQGHNFNVKIALTVKLDKEKQYLVTLYEDTDGDTEFNDKKDVAAKGPDGAIIEKKVGVAPQE